MSTDLKIFDSNPEFINALTLSMFKDLYGDPALLQINNAIKLGSYPQGHCLLEKLIEKNPALAPAMEDTLHNISTHWIYSFEAYLHNDTVKNCMQAISFFRVMLIQPQAERVFKHYFTTRFLQQDFGLSVTNKNAKKTVIERLYKLLTTPISPRSMHLIAILLEETRVLKKNILSIIFDLPMFCQQVKPKDLEFSWVHVGLPNKNLLMYEFVASQEGLMLFHKLLIANPQLTNSLSKSLFLMIPAESGKTLIATLQNTYHSMPQEVREEMQLLQYLEKNCLGYLPALNASMVTMVNGIMPRIR